ncbi:MAG: FAD binding domain-containing protein [Proteobacteria bacterium]|nr:FAD binding domain-containing protein [Pseudomonadota bacterium]
MTKKRDYILVYLNGKRKEIRGKQAFMSLSDYLRYDNQLTGTKVVCAEGDCGACTVLVGSVIAGKPSKEITYKAINSCIIFMHSLDCSQIVSIEGLNENDRDTLHPIQQSMVDCHGTQCGFCTPGFVMAISGMLEQKQHVCEKQARNYLTGNLCRCTGYQSIINSVLAIDTSEYKTIKSRYHSDAVHDDLLAAAQCQVTIKHEAQHFYQPTSIDMAVEILDKTATCIHAAATDLGVQFNKGQLESQNALSLQLIPVLHEIEFNNDYIRIGARVTFDQLQKSIKKPHPEFVKFLNIFASPQIKNNATLIGNIANGSPIGDALPFLMVMEARLVIQSTKSIRTSNITDFYTGYRQMNLADNELITYVEIPYKKPDTSLKLYKVSQRRDLDISCVSCAFKFQFNENDKLIDVAIALGGVAATVIRLPVIENQLTGLSRDELCQRDRYHAIAAKISHSIKPMSDVRGSEQFRKTLIANLYKKFITELLAEQNMAATL